MDQPIHIVDMYPTLLGLAGAALNKSKPLDGLNVWPVISEGKPSPRNEVVYNIGPFFAAVREGDWKLVWQTALPSRIELFNLAQDLSEKNNPAEKNPQKVAELQQRIQKLAQEAAQPLFLKDALGATKHVLFGSLGTPDEEKDLEMQP